MQIDTLLLVVVFESFWSKYIEIYRFDLGYSLLASELTWQAALEKTKVELELLTGVDMPHVLGWQQSIWMGSVTKVAC